MMGLRRTFFSLVLAGGTIWCLGLVRQVHSEEKAAGSSDKYVPVVPASLLAEAQEGELKLVQKAASAESPKFKEIQSRATYIAELFNVEQYVAKADGKAAVEGRDKAVELAAAAKAKDAEGVKKLLDVIATAIKKSQNGEAAAAPGPFKPVSKVHPLMEAQQDLFDAIKKALDSASEDDFKKAHKDALLLAELCNVNRYQKEGKPDYVDWAVQARDQSLKISKAAGAKDAEGVRTGLKQLHGTCGACHDKYQ